MTVSVRDSRGRVVRDLKQADFEVIDSGFGKPITDFWAGDAPISLAMLLDISGSMAVGGNMDRARQAVDLALANMRYGDEAALFTFDSQLQEVVPFTTDLDGSGGQPRGQAVGDDVALRRHRRDGAGGGRARQPASRACW